ncbi:MAG TPA: glycosyltransferase [Polyangiaceae bacterium]|nr:glycosyltransferase [Polyangiaceae bacterium]
MNICLATSTFPANPDDAAHAAFLLEVIRVIESRGHRVSVLTQVREPTSSPPLPSLDVVWFPWLKLGDRLAELTFGSMEGALSAASLVANGVRHLRLVRKSRRIDAFLCAWMIPSGFYAYLDQVLFRSRVPYALWALGSDVNKYRSNDLICNVLRRVAGRAAAVYADGYGLCDDVQSMTGRPCEFLPTFRSFRGAPITAPPEHTPKRFLFVGRHIAVKGIDVLVDALIAMKNGGHDAYRVDFVGDGEMTPLLKNRIAAAGLSQRARFLGRLSDEALARAYSDTDCLVIPSRSESIPIVMSEALQHGVPLIVSDVGDMGMLARRYGLGEVVPSGDPDALARALTKFIAKPWRLDDAQARELLSKLTFEGAADRLLSRLEQLVVT